MSIVKVLKKEEYTLLENNVAIADGFVEFRSKLILNKSDLIVLEDIPENQYEIIAISGSFEPAVLLYRAKFFLPNKPDAELEKNEFETYRDRLVKETRELVEKYEKLQDFMRTTVFYKLPRRKKKLMYKQSRIMNEYIEVLGERLELEGINLLNHKDWKVTP